MRGACHLRATFYKPELSGMLEGLDDDQFVDTYVDWEDRVTIMDTLTVCRFYRDLLPWERIVPIVTELNGAPVTVEQLKTLARDTITRIRALNFAFGATPADDTVAERFFREATDKAPALDRPRMQKWVAVVLAAAGLDERGAFSLVRPVGHLLQLLFDEQLRPQKVSLIWPVAYVTVVGERRRVVEELAGAAEKADALKTDVLDLEGQ